VTDLPSATYLPRPIRKGALRRTLQAHLAARTVAPVESAAYSSAVRGLVLLAEDNLVNQRVAERLLATQR